MMKKNLYKIISVLTLFLPISIFLIFSAITGDTYDAEVFVEEDTVINFYIYEDGYIVNADNASYTGYIVPYNDKYGIYIKDEDVVKIGKDYFMPYNNELTNFDDIPVQPQANQRWAISIASIVALGIVGLIIGGKMDLLKTHPRLSALITLIVVTSILWGLNSIIEDMLNVFLIATASWFAYCLEYLVKANLLTTTKADETQVALLKGLKELVK